MIRRRHTAVLLAVLMVTLAACTSTTAGTAQSGGPSGDSPQTRAPKVVHPLDASAFLAKPCTALSPGDTAALGLSGAQASDNSDKIGPGCVFAVGEMSIGIDWEVVDNQGLSAIYQLRPRQAYWVQTTVEGYPAVQADNVDSRASLGECVVNVGVNDQLFFLASSDGAKDADAACSMAMRAAGAVIRNLQAAQGGG